LEKIFPPQKNSKILLKFTLEKNISLKKDLFMERKKKNKTKPKQFAATIPSLIF